MLAFLYGASYTENCYSCSFANMNRVSDITLGDSWGSGILEELNQGISLILIQNKKGKKLVKDADIELRPVDLDVAVEHNQQLNHPVLKTNVHLRFANAITNNNSFLLATIKSIPKAVIIQRMKTVRNTILRRKDNNEFGLRILP